MFLVEYSSTLWMILFVTIPVWVVSAVILYVVWALCFTVIGVPVMTIYYWIREKLGWKTNA